jgi:hypothetical protein
VPYKLPTRVPQTIEDAIFIAQEVGFQYLWVDRYCIDYVNSNVKHQQIAAMDLVYSRARFTIIDGVGTDADSGLTGVSRRRTNADMSVNVGNYRYFPVEFDPIDSINLSAWATRAWTYQERFLSSHCLFFSQNQAHFQCRNRRLTQYEHWTLPLGLNAFDSNSILELSQIPASDIRLHMFSETPELLSWSSYGYSEPHERDLPLSFALFEQHMISYTARNMTYSTDSLNAALAIFEVFMASFPGFRIYHGIPFLSSDICYGRRNGVPKIFTFTHGLCWTHGATGNFGELLGAKSRRNEFPSWSWAGWTGNVQGWLPGHSLNFVPASDSLFANTETGQLKPFIFLSESSPNTVSSPSLLAVQANCFMLRFAFRKGHWCGTPNFCLKYLGVPIDEAVLHISRIEAKGQNFKSRLCNEKWIGVPLGFQEPLKMWKTSKHRVAIMLVVGRVYPTDEHLERIGILLVPTNILREQEPAPKRFWLG